MAGVDLTVDVLHSSDGEVPVPSTATSVVLGIQVGDVRADTLVYAHPCGAPVDTAEGAVVRIFGPVTVPSTSMSNEAIVPVAGGTVCLRPTSTVRFVGVRVIAYADATPGGLSYVDIPDKVLFDATVSGEVDVPIVAPGLPPNALYVALGVFGYTRDTLKLGATAISYGACSQGSLPQVYGSGEQLVATTLLFAVAQARCQLDAADADVQLVVTGYWTSETSPTTTEPPAVRYRSDTTPRFTSLVPTRLVDTRDGGARVAGGGVLDVDLAARAPAAATAVTLNVTATASAGPGFVTVYPCGTTRPLASNLNLGVGRTTANAVIVTTGATNHVCLYASTPTHLIVDLAGWYQDGVGDGFVPSDPLRLFDTRTAGVPVASGGVYELRLSDKVSADATAVVMNVTVTQPGGAGFLTAYPCDSPRPVASNLNFVTGQTVPNLVTVKLSADRKVCFFAQTRTHLLADLAGAFSPSSHNGFIAVDPVRLFDTRDSAGSVRVPAQSRERLAFRRRHVAWVMNVTVADPTASGYLTVYPCSSGQPTASNLNYVPGDTVPNLVVVRPGLDLDVCFFNQAATHYLADEAGYYTDQQYFAYLPTAEDSA